MEVTLAAGYTRQSKGKERSIEEQEAAIRETCTERGWQVSEIYSDTVSASRFSHKERADWTRLLADLKAGSFRVLVIWESSRGDRDLETWAALLARCRECKVLIHVIAHEHTYNMANPRDWRTLAEEGVHSASESELISQRVRRTIDSQAAKGKPHGRLRYGYRRVYDMDTRELKAQVPEPDQALIVSEIFTRIAAGVPIKTIADDLTARKVPAPRSAAKWERSVVRRIALDPTYIGRRSYNGQMFDAIWPPLVNEVTFFAAKRLLEDPARKTTRPGRARWLLSYLATCDVCGAPLAVQPHGDGKGAKYPLYRCSARACVFIRVEHLDAYVKGRVLRLMSEVTFTGDDKKALVLRGEAARLQADLDDKARACAQGHISTRSYALMEADTLPRIAKLTKDADAAAIPLPMRGVSLGQWDELDIAVRREVIRAAYEIRIRKRATPGKGFDAERVIMTLRQDSATEATG